MHTPNIDRLASKGIVFDAAYAQIAGTYNLKYGARIYYICTVDSCKFLGNNTLLCIMFVLLVPYCVM